MIPDGLSDEHMRHIWRFLKLGEFDRQEFERQRAYARFKARHWQMMAERDKAEVRTNKGLAP